MSRTKLRAALGAAILSTSALTSAPAWADLPVTDPISDGILNAMQSAVTSAISNMEKSLQQAMTDITNPTSLRFDPDKRLQPERQLHQGSGRSAAGYRRRFERGECTVSAADERCTNPGSADSQPSAVRRC